VGLQETEKLLHIKEMVTRLKRQLREWEKIFASCTSDKELNNQNIQSSKN
jgi:hypothetical protein